MPQVLNRALLWVNTAKYKNYLIIFSQSDLETFVRRFLSDRRTGGQNGGHTQATHNKLSLYTYSSYKLSRLRR